MAERRLEDVDPGLPIKLGPCSNGEFVPGPPSPLVRETVRRARAEADAAAQRLGMSRRRFLLSSMGAALTLGVLGACSSDKSKASGASPGGTFSIPPDASTDPGAASSAVGGTEAILDVQTHLLDYAAAPEGPDFFSGFPQRNCGESDERVCFDLGHWMEELFLRSD